MKNTIDILIPAYNAEKFIDKCLTSLVNQTYKDTRIVVVDDGSKDGTWNLLNNYAKKYPNIEIYQKENTKSISDTRNFLLSKIKSDYFTFIDIDDYAEPDYIESLFNLMQAYDADMSICARIRHYEKKSVNVKKLNKNEKIYIFDRHNAIAEMLSSNLFCGTNYCKLFKTSCLKDAQFDKNIHYGEDLDFCFKIMNNCNKFVYTSKKLYHYIIQKNSIVMSKFNPKKLTLIDCYDKIIDAVKGNDELYTCARAMQGLICIELLYYVVRDKFKDKQLKKKLKKNIRESMKFVKKNKRFGLVHKLSPLICWITQIL